jgi:hypothetical protein
VATMPRTKTEITRETTSRMSPEISRDTAMTRDRAPVELSRTTTTACTAGR